MWSLSATFLSFLPWQFPQDVVESYSRLLFIRLVGLGPAEQTLNQFVLSFTRTCLIVGWETTGEWKTKGRDILINSIPLFFPSPSFLSAVEIAFFSRKLPFQNRLLSAYWPRKQIFSQGVLTLPLFVSLSGSWWSGFRSHAKPYLRCLNQFWHKLNRMQIRTKRDPAWHAPPLDGPNGPGSGPEWQTDRRETAFINLLTARFPTRTLSS